LYGHGNSIESYVPKVTYQFKPLPLLELRQKHVMLLLIVWDLILVDVDWSLEGRWAEEVSEVLRWEILVSHVNEVFRRFDGRLKGLRIDWESHKVVKKGVWVWRKEQWSEEALEKRVLQDLITRRSL
jgi:hypothetical protein